ncbi:MAG: PEP-CTERM sorting domain-containing protein [Telluria sp.]
MNAAKSLIATLLLAAAALAPAAQATVINFNGATGAGNLTSYTYATATTFSGYAFKPTLYTYATGSDYSGQGDAGYYAYNGSDFYMTYDALTIKSSTASPFKLNSVDLTRWYANTTGNTATFTGAKVGGGSVTQTVDLSSIDNYINRTGNDFTTYSLTGFDNLSSLTITHNFVGYLAMDNFVLNASSVPEPSSIALFGLAVAAGAFARRRAAKAA